MPVDTRQNHYGGEEGQMLKRNKRIEKINSTGVAGVSMDRGKYRAIIYVNNKKVDLGRHDTLEEAAEARRQGEIKYWGVSA